jgi:diamine N-acetyltransferase
MEDTLVIRNANADDINTIGYLAHEIWPHAYGSILSPQQLQYMLSLIYDPVALARQMHEQQHHFLIAAIDLKEIGFAGYSAIEKNIVKLHKLYVLPNLHGRGVGKALLQVVTDETKKAGARQLQLNVNRNNKAKLFYEKLGFIIIGEEDIDIGNGFFMNDYIMEKTLEDNDE